MHGKGNDFLICNKVSDQLRGPSIFQWTVGTMSPGTKETVREAHHKTPQSAEFKNASNFNFTLLWVHTFIALRFVQEVSLLQLPYKFIFDTADQWQRHYSA
jgi:hypothetical protein